MFASGVRSIHINENSGTSKTAGNIIAFISGNTDIRRTIFEKALVALCGADAIMNPEIGTGSIIDK